MSETKLYKDDFEDYTKFTFKSSINNFNMKEPEVVSNLKLQ